MIRRSDRSRRGPAVPSRKTLPNPSAATASRIDGVRTLFPSTRDYGEGQELLDFYWRVRQAFASHPGVRGVGLAQHVPLRDQPWFTLMDVEGHESAGNRGFPVNIMTADAGYFGSLRIPLRSGRLFDLRDTSEALPVVIINETMGRVYWPTESPLGKRITIQRRERVELTVVGVVGDVNYSGLDQKIWPRLYAPFDQSPRYTMTVFAKVDGDPLSLAPALRETLGKIDNRVPVTRLQSLEQAVGESLLLKRLLAQLLAVFGLLALALAASGVYGVVSFAVSRSIHDIGVRMALGAPSRRVLAEVVRRGMMPVFAGLLIGIGVTWAAGSVVAAQLYGVSQEDPYPLLAVTLLLGLVALTACLLPARRASRVDPILVLRND